MLDGDVLKRQLCLGAARALNLPEGATICVVLPQSEEGGRQKLRGQCVR
jgi:hypothetical protein